jgi:hypothetical protein
VKLFRAEFIINIDAMRIDKIDCAYRRAYKPLARQFSRHSGLSWDNDGPDNYFFARIFIWRGGC